MDDRYKINTQRITFGKKTRFSKLQDDLEGLKVGGTYTGHIDKSVLDGQGIPVSPLDTGVNDDTVNDPKTYVGFEEKGDGRNKLFGREEWFGLKGGKRTSIETGREFKAKTEDFLKQFDNLDRDHKNAYLRGLQRKAQEGNENAIATLTTLQENGKTKGDIMDFIEGSNDKFFGGIGRGLAKSADFFGVDGRFGSGDWSEGADREAEDNSKATTWGKRGETAGSVQKGIVDVASMVIPAAGAQRALEGTRALSALSQVGRGGKMASSVAANVGAGGVATGVGILQNPEKNLTGDNIALNTGIDAAIGVAAPVLGSFIKGIRNAKNTKEVEEIIKQFDGQLPGDLTQQVRDLARSGLSKKDFGAQVSKLVGDYQTERNSIDTLAKELDQADEFGRSLTQTSDQKLLPGADPNATYSNFRRPESIESDIARFQSGQYDEADDVFKTTSKNTKTKASPDYAKEREALSKQYDKEIEALGKSKKSEIYKTKQAGEIEAKYAKLNDDLDARYTDDAVTTTGESVGRELDPKKVRARFRALQKELEDSQQFYGNLGKSGMGDNVNISPSELQGRLDGINSGNIPDEFMTSGSAPKSLDDIINSDSFGTETRNAARSVMIGSAEARGRLSQLMTNEKYINERTVLDDWYRTEQENVSMLPQYLQEDSLRQLDDDYATQIQKLESQHKADAIDVENQQKIIQHYDAKADELVQRAADDVNLNPDDYRVPDSEKLDVYTQRVQSDLDEALKSSNVSDTPVVVRAAEDGKFDDLSKASRDGAEVATDAFVEQIIKNYQPHKFVPFLSPSLRLEAVGLRDLHTNILLATGKTIDSTNQDIKILNKISKTLRSGKVTNDDLINFLQGKPSKLTDRGVEGAQEIRKFLDDKLKYVKELRYKQEVERLTKMNAARVKNQTLVKPYTDAEIKSMAKEVSDNTGLDNYFPHLFKGSKNRIITSYVDTSPKASTYFGSLKHRTTNAEDYSRDTMNVLTEYVTQLNRKYYLEPSLKQAEKVLQSGKLQDSDGKVVAGLIRRINGKDPSALENFVNDTLDKLYGSFAKTKGRVGLNHYRRGLGAQRATSAFATMGMNVTSALNQLTQGALVIGDLNPKWTYQGMADSNRLLRGLLKPELADSQSLKLIDELKQSGVVTGDVQTALNADSLADDMFKEFGNKAGTGLRMSMAGVTGIDRFFRVATYLGTRKKLQTEAFKTLKKTNPAATLEMIENDKDLMSGIIKKAAEKTTDLNFVTSRVDAMPFMNSPLARSLTQFATFPAKAAERLTKMGIDVVYDYPTGAWRFSKEGAAKLAGTLATAYGMYWTVGQATGQDMVSQIPFYSQLEDLFSEEPSSDSIYKSPLVSLLAGRGSRTGLIEGTAGSIRNLFVPEDGESRDTLSKFWNDNWSTVVPSGTQAKKSIDAWKAYNEGWARNSSGNVQFKQDKDLKTLIFGKYSSQSGQDWINGGFPTLSEKQTDGAMSATDQQAVYDYYAGTKQLQGRTKAIDKIKAEIANGNVNKARRLMDEYNAAIDKLIRDTGVNGSNAPQGLIDDYSRRIITEDTITKSIENDTK